jgi:hypothetical protein
LARSIQTVRIAGQRLGTKIVVPPSLGDIDGNGTLDVIAAVNEEYVEAPNAVFENGFIRALQATGTLESGNTRIYAVYADGVAHGSSGMERGWNPDAFLTGWPVKIALLTTELLPTVGSGSNSPPALADVDHNGTLEIATMSAVGPLYVFTADGISFFGQHDSGEDRTLETEKFGTGSNSVDTPTFGGLGALALAEFGGAGEGFHVLAPAAGLGKLIDNQVPADQIPSDNHIGAWVITEPDDSPSDRRLVPAFPRLVNDLQILTGPSVADIDGDGLPEILEGSGISDLHAVNINGVEATGWPKFTSGWMVQSPTVGDLQGDGGLEVIGSTREGNLFVWKTIGNECGFIPWRRWHHDEWGTGNYGADTRPPASLQAGDVTASAMGPIMLRLDLTRVPGDGLFCGTAAFDVRVSETPIVDEASFAAATRLSSVQSPGGSRSPGIITATDTALVGRNLYIGLVARDGAGNRSALVTAGRVQFPDEEPPSPTITPAVTDTPAPTNTTGPTNTVAPTNTSVPSPTDTVGATVTATPPVTPTNTELGGTVTPTVTRTVPFTESPTAMSTTTRTTTAVANTPTAAMPRMPTDARPGWRTRLRAAKASALIAASTRTPRAAGAPTRTRRPPPRRAARPSRSSAARSPA